MLYKLSYGWNLADLLVVYSTFILPTAVGSFDLFIDLVVVVLFPHTLFVNSVRRQLGTTGYKDNWVQRKLGTLTTWYSDNWVQIQLGTATSGHSDNWVQRQLGTTTTGYSDYWVQ